MDEIIIILNGSLKHKKAKVNFDIENKAYHIYTNSIDEDINLCKYYIDNIKESTLSNKGPISFILNSFTDKVISDNKITHLITFNINFLIDVYYTQYKTFFSFIQNFKKFYLQYEKKIDIKYDVSSFMNDDCYLLFIIIMCYLSTDISLININMYIEELSLSMRDIFIKANVSNLNMLQNVSSLFSNEQTNKELFYFFHEIYNTNLFRNKKDYLVLNKITENKLIINPNFVGLFLELCISKDYYTQIPQIINIFSNVHSMNNKLILHINEYHRNFIDLLVNNQIVFYIINDPINLYSLYINYEQKFIWIGININKSNIELINIIKEIQSIIPIETVIIAYIYNSKRLKIKVDILTYQIKIYKANDNSLEITKEDILLCESIETYLPMELYAFNCYDVHCIIQNLLRNHHRNDLNSLVMFRSIKHFITAVELIKNSSSDMIIIKNVKDKYYERFMEIVNKDVIEFPCNKVILNGSKDDEKTVVKYKRNYDRVLPVFFVIKKKMKKIYKRTILLNIIKFLTKKITIMYNK